MTAQRTADFLISLFQVFGSSEARGNSVTARSILDRGAQQIQDSLRDEPRSELNYLPRWVRSTRGHRSLQARFESARGGTSTQAQQADARGRETV